MKIKDMFWKLFRLMIRGKGDARILFDSEAVCFKAHMIEITDARFNPEEGGGLGEFLTLSWDSQVDQYVRIKGDIDDLQAIIKHVNDEEEEFVDEFAPFDMDIGKKEPYKLKYTTGLTPEETERLLEMRIPQQDNDGD